VIPLLDAGTVIPLEFEPGRLAGCFSVRRGREGAVLGAPHGSSDPHTGGIAAEVARHTGLGVVIATGFTLESDTRARPGRRFQVNRPTEGVPGRRPSEEIETALARRVYAEFERHVLAAAGAPLAFYAEIHGNGRRETAGRIEIATVGVSFDEAQILRVLFEQARDRCLVDRPAPALDLLVEPCDRLWYTASAAKRGGILRLPRRALHIEIPKAARTNWRDAYTAVLADFLAEIALRLGDSAPTPPP
jgi:hypothetical protein